MTGEAREVSREQDVELIQRVLSNPSEGWEEFQAIYDRFLLKVTRRFDLAQEDEEEVYQEICLQLVKNDFKVPPCLETRALLPPSFSDHHCNPRGH